METKSVLLVDAFADEPLAGVPVPVVVDAVTRNQLRAIAAEFGASGAVAKEDGQVVYVERERSRGSLGVSNPHGLVEAGVAGFAGLSEHDMVEPDTETFTVVASDGSEQTYPIDSDSERDIRVELPAQEVTETDLSLERLTPALGTSIEAVKSGSRELPLGRTDGFGGTLFVPVGFLDGLTTATPDRETLDAVCSDTETARVCAFTFDTLARRADLHARVFDPTAVDCERPASGVAVAACGQYLRHHDAFDGDIDTLRVECGHFLDRPGTVETTLASNPRVGGRALTVLDGSIAVPEDRGDDIIEV